MRLHPLAHSQGTNTGGLHHTRIFGPRNNLQFITTLLSPHNGRKSKPPNPPKSFSSGVFVGRNTFALRSVKEQKDSKLRIFFDWCVRQSHNRVLLAQLSHSPAVASFARHFLLCHLFQFLPFLRFVGFFHYQYSFVVRKRIYFFQLCMRVGCVVVLGISSRIDRISNPD